MSRFLSIALVCSMVGVGHASPPPTEVTSNSAIASHLVHYSEKVMGTVVDINIWSDDEENAARGAHEVFAEFQRVNALMSSWLDDSAVATINRNAGKAPVVVNKELMGLILRAHTAGKRSRGAFDISVGAFRGLWKFDQDNDGSIPNAKEVKKRAKLVNYKRVVLNKKRSSVKLTRKGMRITLGGIAKGYAVDQAVAILRKRGLNDFILQAGGDLYASGQKGDRAWRVGIRDPRGDREESFAMMEITDKTFSTSGDYERFVIKDGLRYHHLLDPATGRPASRSRSVTVVANDALTADIWSTALFVMGHKRGMKLVEASPELEAVFVDKDNSLHVSSGIADKLVVVRPPSEGI